MQPPSHLLIKPAGDRALVVDFEERIDRAVNKRVRDLQTAITAADWPEIAGMVPSYRSLLVYYDPIRVDFSEIEDRIRRLSEGAAAPRQRVRRWNIPVCYEGHRAVDLVDLAGKLGLTAMEIVQLHSSVEYMVYMTGFSPGFCYLGELPTRLEVQRKSIPAALVPANAVQIGGQQTALSSMPMPSGWYVVGQTPLRMFSAERSEPFLLSGGDLVSFSSISEIEYDRLSDLISRDAYRAEWEWAA